MGLQLIFLSFFRRCLKFALLVARDLKKCILCKLECFKKNYVNRSQVSCAFYDFIVTLLFYRVLSKLKTKSNRNLKICFPKREQKTMCLSLPRKELHSNSSHTWMTNNSLRYTLLSLHTGEDP